jgi:murein DD-endopeptidase MepM/ murein hydrolase activator NlpD
VITHLALGGVAALTAGLLSIPLVIGGNGSAVVGGCGTTADMPIILDTIRTLESGGRYDIRPNKGGASGAYQYIDSTWADYGGYDAAYLAPPEIQDARAATDVQRVLDRYGDVGAVPITWYWPRALEHPADLDIVPMPGAGNTLTVREYQTRWLRLYESKRTAAAERTPTTTSRDATPSTPPTVTERSTGTEPPSATMVTERSTVTELSAATERSTVTETSAATITTCTGAIAPNADGYALPIPRSIIDADPAMLTRPHHDYPALDLPVPIGTPIYAVRGGTVARIVDWPHNCSGRLGCVDPCGIGVSINAADGERWIYCHGSRLNVAVGQQVTAGQIIMWSGNTGRSSGPHLHLELKVNGTRLCPQAILFGAYELGPGSIMAVPSLPTRLAQSDRQGPDEFVEFVSGGRLHRSSC